MNHIRTAFTAIFPEAEGEDWFPSEPLFVTVAQNPQQIPETGSILENARWAAIPEDWNADIVRAAETIRNNEHLSAVYSLAVHLLLDEEERYDGFQFRYWPDPEGTMDADAPLFYLLLSLECVTRVRELHSRTAIPEELTRDTCSGIGTKAYDYFFFHGRPGTAKWALWWFRHHIKGRLYRVGRLEFIHKQLYEGVSLFRKEDETRLVCKDPESGEPVCLVYGSGDIRQTEPKVSPVHALEDWDRCLGPDDYVLDIHIPGGGGLTPDCINDSLSRALTFFDALYPETDIRGFECVSWIFSPDLEAAFPPGANLILLRNRVYPFPVKSNRVEGLQFIFGTYSENPADWPEKTSVQRRLKQHLVADGTFRISGMVLLRSDVENSGTV